MFYSQLSKDFQTSCDAMVNEDILAKPRPKMINNRPLTGYMLLGLALEYVDCLNQEVPPIVSQCFDRVVSIESDRVIERLYEDIVESINQTFTFEMISDDKSPFSNLERVYSQKELDQYLENLIEQCDNELANRLRTILTVRNLVEVRN